MPKQIALQPDEAVAVEDLEAQVLTVLKMAIEMSGLSYAEIARRLHVHSPQVSAWASGKNTNLTVRSIARILYACGNRVELMLDEVPQIEGE